MPAYVIANVHVTDPDAYEDYKAVVPETIAAYGGRFLVRGGASEVLEGDWQPGRIVVLEFDSVARAKEWWASREYAEPKALRQRASTGTLIVVPGAD